jgi:hypothetical protein
MPRQSNSKVTPIKTHIKPISTVPSTIITKNNTTLFGSIKEGFGFGIGSTIARNLFSTTPISASVPILASNSCIEYKKCLESNDKYECFGNLDQKEYIECRTNN